MKLPGPLLVVVGGLYEAHLAVALQIQIVLQAFITRIRHHFLVAGLVPLGQLLQHGTQRPHIRAVWECFQPGDIFAVYRDLDIVPRLELAVSHVVLFHPHKGGIGFRAAVASFSHGGKHCFIPLPPLQKGLLLLPVPLSLAFALTRAPDKHDLPGFLFLQ